MSHSQYTHRHKQREPHRPSAVVATNRLSQPSSELLFTIDRKGDLQNLRYGSIDKHKVPKYRTAGYGRLLGLDRRFKVISTTPTEREIDNVAIDWASRIRNLPRHVKDQTKEDEPPVPISAATQDEFIEQQNYVRFGNKRRRLSKIEEGDRPESIRAPIHPLDGDSSDSESASSSSGAENAKGKDAPDEDAFQRFKNHPDNKKYVDLRRQTSENPQDATAWLELIEHQERFFKLSAGDARGTLNSSQRHAVADMRISLYEKAITYVRDGQAKEELILGLMKEGSKIWDVGKQIKEWKGVLHQARSPELWFEYLNFQQTNAIAFSYEKCLETYLEVWTILSSNGGGQDGEADHRRIHLVLRLTRFMFDAGFTERAIATWQALLEYNFFRPTSRDASLDAFGAFWESEYARVGEESAKGWCSNTEQEVPLHADIPLTEIKRESLFADWANDEAQRSVDEATPARILDNTTEDDPFRVIVFADVKDFVFNVNSHQAEQSLLQAFLKFCGLPAMCHGIDHSRSWWKDAYLYDYKPNLLPGKLLDTSALFAPPTSPLFSWDLTTVEEKGVLNFAACVLQQLAERVDSNDFLAEYTIALHLQKDPKCARKWAKAMLKRRPNSLLLYNAYAFVEQRCGKTEVAANVWSTALTMSNSLGQRAQRDKVILWHSWIWELMSQQRYDFVRGLITIALPLDTVTNESIEKAAAVLNDNPGLHLRSDAYLCKQISSNVNKDGDKVVEFTDVYAMSQYLNYGKDVTQAMEVYQSTMSILKQQRYRHLLERLHQSRARFVYLHTALANSGYRPMQMVEVLRESTTTFPDNPLFVTLHEKYLRSAGVIDRLRVSDVGTEFVKDIIIQSLQEIAKELSRPLYSGSTSHSVRRAFTKATATDNPAAHVPAIWTSWIRWELTLVSHHAVTAAKRAKDVYLSAIRSCPWCKDIYLVAFSENLLRQELGDRGLAQIFRSMIERGLRVRHDITEVLDDKE